MTAGSLIDRLLRGSTPNCSFDGRVRFSCSSPLPAALLAEARHHREAIVPGRWQTKVRRPPLRELQRPPLLAIVSPVRRPGFMDLPTVRPPDSSNWIDRMCTAGHADWNAISMHIDR